MLMLLICQAIAQCCSTCMSRRNNWCDGIKPLNQNGELLKQKASFSVIAWLKRNIATPVWWKFASRVVDRTERLYGDRLMQWRTGQELSDFISMWTRWSWWTVDRYPSARNTFWEMLSLTLTFELTPWPWTFVVDWVSRD